MARLAHPRHWPSWALVGVFYVLGRLPMPVLWALGQALGRLGYWLARSRRRVASKNLELCFPELDSAGRSRLMRRHFGWLGVAALTQGLGWSASRARLRRLVRVRNRGGLDAYLAAGRPVIVFVPHFVGLELGGMAFTVAVRSGVYMYQKIRDPVVNWRVKRARTRFGNRSIERQDDLRGLVRTIKRGIPFLYLPDQDAGRRGVFVPFCGVAASTVPTLGRFAALTGAAVVPTIPRFLPFGRGLELTFAAPLEGFPSGDLRGDAAQMNQCIESWIRTIPEQYFWVHRRFKPSPAGEPPIYPGKVRWVR